MPFVLSLLFVGTVAAWLQATDLQDQEEQQHTLIRDALTLERVISVRIDSERQQLEALARSLGPAGDAAQLAARRGAVEGLRRLWISLTWLDAGNRIVAHLPDAPAGEPPVPEPGLRASGLDESGLSAHLRAVLIDAAGAERGTLVARYRPATMLRQSVPWWLARKYDVRLVDSWGQTLASTGEGLPVQGRQSHRVTLEPALPDAWLELVARDRHVAWWRTLPLALMGVFLLLVGAATAMLRRQVRQVMRAEAAWRTEAAWRRAMEDSLTVGLRARDNQGRLVYVNRAFCEQVGWGPEDLIGRDPPMPYWPKDAIDESLQRSLRTLSGGAPHEGYEARWVHRSGRPIDVMIFEARLVDALGRHIGWMGSTVDITERKRMEERERHRTEAMAQQARLTTLGEVASALAHQLNQPLTAITGYNAGVLRSLERAGFDDAVVLQAVRALGEQAAEAGRIVKRIREFLTRRSPQRERCDLAATARRAVELLQRDLRRLGVAVDWQLATPLPAVLADPVLIEQVLINLLRNACDEMAAAATPAPRIVLTLSVSGTGFVRVDVDDAGPGLGGRGIEQLCAPFYSTKSDGMGMGLAICRSVIEAHHGGFDASVGALGGARFSFTLPVAPEGVVDAESAP
jgi:two-component system sensor histidine kinase DctS